MNLQSFSDTWRVKTLGKDRWFVLSVAGSTPASERRGDKALVSDDGWKSLAIFIELGELTYLRTTEF